MGQADKLIIILGVGAQAADGTAMPPSSIRSSLVLGTIVLLKIVEELFGGRGAPAPERGPSKPAQTSPDSPRWRAFFVGEGHEHGGHVAVGSGTRRH